MDKSDNFGLSPDNDARADTIEFQKTADRTDTITNES
jgi:hypothetical protein